MAVKSLKSSQPLAFKILTLTTIACLHESCTWSGCYSEFNSHRQGHRKKCAESQLKNTSISNANAYRKERYESQSPFGHEAKHSESSTYEVLKPRKMRSYTIDSTHVTNFDKSFFAQTHYNASGTGEVCSLSSEFSRKCDVKHDDESMNNRNGHDLFAKAKKLKEQANAKFNAGSYLEARALYTDGINMVKESTTMTNDDLTLLADMYSNRAATFYRYKKFDECVGDCEDAIRCDGTLDKAWIRKWRALMVKGAFHNAHTFLEDAVAKLPDSNRIKDEYDRSVKEMDTISLLMNSIEAGSRIDADKILNESFDLSSCVNVLLMKCYAEVMISNGDVNVALMYIDRVLEINPTHEECLEFQGICLFYNGNIKEAIQVLSESCRGNNSIKLKAALARVQNCYTLHIKAKVHTKHGRHDEANELLTALIRACEPLPTKSMLFSLIRVDRAHNSLQMQKHLDVLQHCQEVIDINRKFIPIWIIRSEVLLALGKSDEARTELMHIRKTWGAGDLAIESKYQKVDFEFRVSRANDDVLALQNALESGTSGTLPLNNFPNPLNRQVSYSKGINRSKIVPKKSNSMERSTTGSLAKKKNHFDGTPLMKSSESFRGASAISGKATITEALDRWGSHSKRERSSHEIPAMVNRTESLSQSSHVISRDKSSDSLEAAFPTSNHVLLRKPSLNKKNRSSKSTLDRQSMHDVTEDAIVSAKSGDCTPAISKSEHVLLRKPSRNEKLNRIASIIDMPSQNYFVDESKGKRVELRQSSHNAKVTQTSDKHPKHELGDEKTKLHRLRRSNSTIESESQRTAVRPRKPPEHHKSSDNILCQAIDKRAEFRQQQRNVTLNAIFGGDWKKDSTRSINVQPLDQIERPELRRLKSDDLMDLRKALSNVYGEKAKKVSVAKTA